MRAFLVQHVYALLTMIVALWVAGYSWRNREQFRLSSNRLTSALPRLAPLIFAFGLLQFILDFYPTYTWERISTRDHRASAEFPCPTTAETATDSLEGLSVQRWTVACRVPHRDIELLLSYSTLPPQAAVPSIDQHQDYMKRFVEDRGFSISSSAPETHGNNPGYRMLVEGDRGKTRIPVRVAVTPKAIYRVVATSTSGFHDDPVITRFVESFSLE